MSMWFETTIKGLTGQQRINDSKTPSGRVHIGSLRGVLIHDALYRSLKDQGVDVIYEYGIDDYDPLDGLPADAGAELVEMMGLPLCNIPAPQGSTATDLADHYITEFLDIFKELGVGATFYRMRDVYRSGQFNAAIDAILTKADVVRQVYREVSKADKPSNWYPFQVVCEQCGKIGASEVTDYDGKEVTYYCKPDLVSWAKGCGYRGKVSAFDGHGKLPWKLEWIAKWYTFGVTIEGGGKDHCTKGGSRDVSEQCMRAVFGGKPPLNVPYEFFLVSGAKMSSSKGVGSSARDMANFLPAELLRYLMIQPPAKRTVNFSTDLEYIVKLFNEYDRLIEAQLRGATSAEQNRLIAMTEINNDSTAYHPVSFQLIVSLLQLPHLEIHSEIAKRLSAQWQTPKYQLSLEKRIAAARYWLDHFSTADQRLQLQNTLPNSVSTLSIAQQAFLQLLGQQFPQTHLDEDHYQTYVFDIARLTPIPAKSAFAAVYKVLFDKDQGPKVGSLFSYIDANFLQNRFNSVNYSLIEFWHETAIQIEQIQQWISEHQSSLQQIESQSLFTTENEISLGIAELTITLTDGKKHRLRTILLAAEEAKPLDIDQVNQLLINRTSELLANLK